MNTKIIHNKKFIFIALFTLSTTLALKALDDENFANVSDSTQVEEKKVRFICQSEGEVGGVVCQMYSCKDGNCQAKTFNLERINNAEENASDMLFIEREENREQVIPTQEELLEQRVEQLEDEIKLAEKACERAETDPREKAICERASAKVQMKKEKIKALEHMAQE